MEYSAPPWRHFKGEPDASHESHMNCVATTMSTPYTLSGDADESTSRGVGAVELKPGSSANTDVDKAMLSVIVLALQIFAKGVGVGPSTVHVPASDGDEAEKHAHAVQEESANTEAEQQQPPAGGGRERGGGEGE